MPDHARIGLDIWGDDDWLDLTPEAQHLYFVLKTWPPSFCGGGDWHPGKIAAKARGWTADAVCEAAQVLVDGLFLLIDVDTDEYLLRSWIKHDGLYKIPNMAVSMANARGALASRLLRGVVVHEVSKLKAKAPDLGSWTRDAVAAMLSQKAVDPAEVEWPNVAPNPPFNPPPNGWVNPSDNPRATGESNPAANPGPTPSPTPAPSTPNSIGGYVSTEGNQRPHCDRHPNENSRENCHACRARREWDQAEEKRAKDDELAHRRWRRECIDACQLCDTNGIRDFGTFSDRCAHPDNPQHLQEVS